jgi:hypothetical protein
VLESEITAGGARKVGMDVKVGDDFGHSLEEVIGHWSLAIDHRADFTNDQ